MASIFEMFGSEELEGEGGDAPFDPSRMDSVLDELLSARPIAGAPAGYVPRDQSAAPTPDGEAEGAEGGGQPAAAPPPPEQAPPPPPPAAPAAEIPPAPPAAPADPFSGLSDLERMEMLAIRQALADPDRAPAVKRAYLGVAEMPAPAAVAPPPEPPPAPALPEHIEPGSFEAQLWQQNVDMQREIAELKAGVTNQAQMSEAQIVQQAARTATSQFAGKYAGRLSQEEIAAVAQLAGAQRLPEAFRPTVGSWEEAMDKALEFTLRSNDALLAKVLGAAPAAPSPSVPPGPDAASITNKRQLTALSSAASPSGESATRTPLEHRGDGRLTEKSRLGLVADFMNSLQGTGEGISG